MERVELSDGIKLAVWDVPGPPSACPGGEGVRGEGPEAEAGKGPPILLLHGIPLASQTWAGVIPRLVETGRRVVAVDLVGMGESDKPLGFAYGLQGLATLVEDLLANLVGEGERWVVAGHDLGGLLALLAAARHPDRVAGAAAFDATASLYHPFPWITLFAARPSSLAGVFRLGQPAGLKGILRPLCRPGTSPPEELVQTGAGAFSRPEAVWAMTKLVEALGLTPEEDLLALRRELAGISRPVLIGRGEEDTALAPEAADDLLELIPGARGATVLEAGHLSPLEQPERVAALLAAFAGGL